MEGSGSLLSTTLETATLGDLLVEERRVRTTTVEVISETTGLSVDRIEAVESGRHDLSPAELKRLLAAYNFNRPFGRFCRPSIEIDLGEGWITMRPTRQIWTSQADADENLVCYLSMLHESCNLAFGTPVPLKSVDLSLLRAALAIRRPDVEAQMGRLGLSLPKPVQEHRGIIAVVASGAAFAAGAMLIPGVGQDTTGSAVTTDQEPTVPSVNVEASLRRAIAAGVAAESPPEIPVIDPRIDIGSALVIERDPQAAIIEPTVRQPTDPQPADAKPVGNLDDNPEIDVGIAVVVERPTDQTNAAGQQSEPRTSRGPPETGNPVSKGRN